MAERLKPGDFGRFVRSHSLATEDDANDKMQPARLASATGCLGFAVVCAAEYPADVQLRIGMCDASAAVALGNDRFIVADDEDNVLRVYRRGQARNRCRRST